MSVAARTAIVGLVAVSAAVLPRAAPAFAQPVTVSIGERLHPATVTVPVGTAVTWTNDDDERHRIRSREGATEFDSGNLEPGQSFSFVFDAAGEHSYVDARDRDDPAYHGLVRVTGGTAPARGSRQTGSPEPAPTRGVATATDQGTAPEAAEVAILDRSFAPATITVADGATVTWSNRSDRDHTVTFRSGGGSDQLGPGASFRHTFPSAGTFAYLCAIHPEMTGTVTVAGAGASAAAGGGAPRASDDRAASTTGRDRPEPPPTVSTPAAPLAPGRSAVKMVDLEFRPARLTVERGATVTWTNDDVAPHTVTGSAFDSGVIEPGGRYERRFDAAGTFPYRCTLHPQMTGTVVVRASAGDSRARGVPGGALGSPQQVASVPPPEVATPTVRATGGKDHDQVRASTSAGGREVAWLIAAFVTGAAAGIVAARAVGARRADDPARHRPSELGERSASARSPTR